MEKKGGKSGRSVLLGDHVQAQEGIDIIFDKKRVDGNVPRMESLISPIKDLKRDILIESCTVVRIWKTLALECLERVVEKPERDNKVR